MIIIIIMIIIIVMIMTIIIIYVVNVTIIISIINIIVVVIVVVDIYSVICGLFVLYTHGKIGTLNNAAKQNWFEYISLITVGLHQVIILANKFGLVMGIIAHSFICHM